MNFIHAFILLLLSIIAYIIQNTCSTTIGKRKLKPSNSLETTGGSSNSLETTGGSSTRKQKVSKNMSSKVKLSLFIFRRDLRIVDNTALIAASNDSEKVLPVFIFDNAQITDKNKYRSDAAVYFMVNSLHELEDEIEKNDGKLNYMYAQEGKTPADVVEDIILKYNIGRVYANSDYTPYSKTRDLGILSVCTKNKIEFVTTHDCLLLDGFKYQSGGTSSKYYRVFTPYHRAFSKTRIRSPNKTKITNFSGINIENSVSPEDVISEDIFNVTPVVHGGRVEGSKILQSLEPQNGYNKDRDQLIHSTTRLSAHNKFGTISIREVHSAFKSLPTGASDLVKQLFWRDFYYTLMAHDPKALKGNYDSKYDKMPWLYSKERYAAWVEGKTGYPIVDAAMREIAETRYMHNRARMIVADFLIKLLNIDWRVGEKYFAQMLVDYDPAQNNYNWQWVAGTGPFSQPYFRVFSPKSQSERFDKKCEYIKKWIPELRDVPNNLIHNYHEIYEEHPEIEYHKPIIDYKTARAEYLKKVKSAI